MKIIYCWKTEIIFDLILRDFFDLFKEYFLLPGLLNIIWVGLVYIIRKSGTFGLVYVITKSGIFDLVMLTTGNYEYLVWSTLKKIRNIWFGVR